MRARFRPIQSRRILESPAAAASIVAAALLFACDSPTAPPDPEPPDGAFYHIADYTSTGDTLFMHMPADTFWDCWSENPTMRIDGPETNASRFEISGDRLNLFEAVDTSRSIASGVESWAVVRRHSRFARTGGGPGLEGRWKWESNGFDVLSESPDGKERTRMARYDSLLALQLGYVTMEVEFSRGEARGRFSGDHAGLFLAAWNGAFAYDSLDRPDSAQYAVEAARLHPDTVRLVGRETGEIVTVYYVGPRKSKWYASDRPDRIPYSQEEYRRVCGIDGWYDEFLEENRRIDPVPKRNAGAFRRASPPPPSAPSPSPSLSLFP